jgi:D-lactate dehydrogenase
MCFIFLYEELVFKVFTMKVGVFSCKPYERTIFESHSANYGFDLVYLATSLNAETVALAKPFDMICVFVNDDINAAVLESLKSYGVSHIALRCMGFNNVDLLTAQSLGISVSRVLHYSPKSVAEHTLGLILALNRKLLKSHNRILNNNFELEGLIGFNLASKCIGIIGTGSIGLALIKILSGFGCRILCYDPNHSELASTLELTYVELPELISESDIISLHCPLNEKSQHIIGHAEIVNMKDKVMIINTCRGDLMNTQAIISGLKSKKIGYLGIDMHEMESELTPENITFESIPNSTYSRLATFSNVLITYHQGFFTHESVDLAVDTTLVNLQYCFVGKTCAETFLT